MVSIIIQGDRAIEVAHALKVAGFCAPGYGPWDLGPDFGETTTRVLLLDIHGSLEAIAFLERARGDGWLPKDGWRPRNDGPPFSGDGEDASVVGTVID